MSILNKIKIILVETSHSGNIGSAARAMKTMGLSQLCLVNPLQDIDAQAIALSAGAKDVLEQAQIFSSFDEAIADCQLVLGSSARLRHLQATLVAPKEGSQIIIDQAKQGNVAIVFGRERVGLTNDELLKCHYHLNVATNPEYSSLNLAMAVQLISYEIRCAYLEQEMVELEYLQKAKKIKPLVEYPSTQALEYFFEHTEKVYRKLGFIKNDAMMPKLRRLYQKTHLEQTELNILRGMLTSIEKKLSKD